MNFKTHDLLHTISAILVIARVVIAEMMKNGKLLWMKNIDPEILLIVALLTLHIAYTMKDQQPKVASNYDDTLIDDL